MVQGLIPSGSRTPRFDLGGGNKRDKILMVVLGVVVLLVVISFAAQFMGGGRGKYKPQDTHLECVACGHTWVLTPEEMREATSMIDPSNASIMMPGMTLIPCPECQAAPATGVVMSKCPACGEYYITEEQRMMAETGRPPEGQLQPAICPHCDVDIRQYLKEQARKGK